MCDASAAQGSAVGDRRVDGLRGRRVGGSSTGSRKRRADPPLAGGRPALRRRARRARASTSTSCPGERRAILGPNGAGKTTLFNVIAGEFPPTAGTIELFGRDVTRLPARTRRRAGADARRTRSPGSSSACRSRTTSTSRSSASRAGHLRPVIGRATDPARCASAPRELAERVGLARLGYRARRLALARRAAPARGRHGARRRAEDHDARRARRRALARRARRAHGAAARARPRRSRCS